MRCKPIEKPSQIFANFDDYLIIAYKETSYQNSIDTKYLTITDDFVLQYVDNSQFKLIDTDSSNFIEVKTKDTSFKLFFDKDFLDVFNKSLTQSDNLEFNLDIWDRTWLAKCLKNKNVELNDELVKAIEDEEYKLSLIKGFLMFANEYINFENKPDEFDDSDESYEIIFHSIAKEKSRLRFERNNFKEIELNKIEAYILNTFERYLFNGKKVNNRDGVISDKVLRKIYLMIDCIFVDGLNSAYTFNQGWTTYTIFDYKDKYFILCLQ